MSETLGMTCLGPPISKQAKTKHSYASDEESSSPVTQEFHQPSSLFSISICFVSKYLHFVDSLCGFPDVVGIQIFQQAREIGKFSSANIDSLHCLAVFCEAYDGEVLSQLNLRFSHLGIADYLDHLCLFSHLSELDVGHCGLGDDHELLQHVSQMSSLTKLGLCDNALSNFGIQKLTTPLRMYKRGPIKLEILNLAENPKISERVTRFLRCFPSLSALNLSSTAIITEQCSTKVARDLMMEVGHVKEFEDGCSLTTNQGWAADIVSEWMSQTCTRTVTRKSRSEAGKFYHRKATLTNCTAAKEYAQTTKNSRKIHLVKKINKTNSTASDSLNPIMKTSQVDGGTSAQDECKSHAAGGTPLASLSKTEQLEENDDDIMKMYLSGEGQTIPSSISKAMAMW